MRAPAGDATRRDAVRRRARGARGDARCGRVSWTLSSSASSARSLEERELAHSFIHSFERDAIDHEVLRERTRGWTFGDVFGRGRRVGDDVRE